MNSKLLPLIILLSVGYIYRDKIHTFISPTVVSKQIVSGDACSEKAMCAIVYMAPWCPACKQLQPAIISAMQALQHHPQNGIQVIMGGEKNPGDNARAASDFGPDVIIDQNGTLQTELNVTYYPTILVVNQKRDIVYKDQEAMKWLNQAHE